MRMNLESLDALVVIVGQRPYCTQTYFAKILNWSFEEPEMLLVNQDHVVSFPFIRGTVV